MPELEITSQEIDKAVRLMRAMNVQWACAEAQLMRNTERLHIDFYERKADQLWRERCAATDEYNRLVPVWVVHGTLPALFVLLMATCAELGMWAQAPGDGLSPTFEACARAIAYVRRRAEEE